MVKKQDYADIVSKDSPKGHEITIACRSWMRADVVSTHKYIPDTKYVVASSQADEYRQNGLNVWECPDSAQGNICRVSNWIMDNCKTRWLIIIDDDLINFGRYNGNKHKKIKSEDVMDLLFMCFMMAEDADVKLWGMNCIDDKGAYREYTPLSFNNYIGGPFQAFIDMDLRYDEKLNLKEDYDMTLQVMNKYRRALRFNFLNYNFKQHVNIGGCASYRTVEREKQQYDLLFKKWGPKIVKKDCGNSRTHRKKEQGYDINPIIKVPIKGV